MISTIIEIKYTHTPAIWGSRGSIGVPEEPDEYESVNVYSAKINGVDIWVSLSIDAQNEIEAILLERIKDV